MLDFILLSIIGCTLVATALCVQGIVREMRAARRAVIAFDDDAR